MSDLQATADRVKVKAETAYRQAVRMTPYDPDGHTRLGEFLQAKGRRKE